MTQHPSTADQLFLGHQRDRRKSPPVSRSDKIPSPAKTRQYLTLELENVSSSARYKIREWLRQSKNEGPQFGRRNNLIGMLRIEFQTGEARPKFVFRHETDYRVADLRSSQATMQQRVPNRNGPIQGLESRGRSRCRPKHERKDAAPEKPRGGALRQDNATDHPLLLEGEPRQLADHQARAFSILPPGLKHLRATLLELLNQVLEMRIRLEGLHKPRSLSQYPSAIAQLGEREHRADARGEEIQNARGKLCKPRSEPRYLFASRYRRRMPASESK